jgi:hypothetical protein
MSPRAPCYLSESSLGWPREDYPSFVVRLVGPRPLDLGWCPSVLVDRKRANPTSRMGDTFSDLKPGKPEWDPDNNLLGTSSLGLCVVLHLPNSLWAKWLAHSLVVARIPTPQRGLMVVSSAQVVVIVALILAIYTWFAYIYTWFPPPKFIKSSPLMYAWIWISILAIYTWFAYIQTKAPPKFCNPWGATSVCKQVDMCAKGMQYDMLFHTTSKREYDGQDFKI